MTLAPEAAPAVRERVDAILEQFLASQARLWSDADRRPVFDAVRHFVLDGGKRLRPAFCYWAWRGAAGDRAADDRAVLTVGAALELFHCFALIHDDIIDGSSRRWGTASLHEAFAARHAQYRWRGDPARFGRSIALLCGDLCASWSDELVRQSGAPPDRSRAAQDLFALARTEAIAGECLDVIAQASGDRDGPGALARALRVTRLKTARYSIVRPMQIGAALAGADRPLLAGYAAAGEPLGDAFQLRDDVLGIFGDPARTGKSVIDDLRQGKVTVLIAMAFARADHRQQRVLRELFGRADLDAAGAASIREIIVACGALDTIEQRIERHLATALESLATTPIGDQARDALTALARRAVRRSA